MNSNLFIGVVEDRADPKQLGRCRVRVLGLHTDDKSKLPTDRLPWANVMNPITSASVDGIGQTPLGPVESSWVVVFFTDGDSRQQPVVMGTLGGTPQAAAKQSKGFNDPNGVYPQNLEEPHTNRLARGETEGTVVENKRADVDSWSTADGSTVDEPETPYNAQYPKNHVRESESGHLEEWDDTEGAERLHKYHRSGSFFEVHPDGTTVRKTKGDGYEIDESNRNIHVHNDYNVTVGGNCTLLVKGNATVQVNGNVNESVKGNVNRQVDGDYVVNADGQVTIRGSQISLNP